jgi:nucleotidyltransferase substrate binding protein (TIGR01987 family)
MQQDIRWIQRLENYGRAITNLESAVHTKKTRDLSPLEEQGLIKAFELVHELAWNTIKDFYEYQGEVKIMGSRDAFRLAFKRELIENGEIFMQSIKTRQQSVHSYSEETAHKIQYEILHIYFAEFKKLYETLLAIQKETDY